MKKYILDFKSIESTEDIRAVLELLARSIMGRDTAVVTSLALEKIPELKHLLIEEMDDV